MTLLLKGGCIVNNDRKFISDILIDKNEIKQLGKNILPTSSDIKIIDVTNKLLFPGAIDSLTNFNFHEKACNQLLAETKAAVAGGTTSIVNVISKDEIKVLKSENIKSMCNYSFIVEIDSNDEEGTSVMEDCAINHGINCFQLKIKQPITKNLINLISKAGTLKCVVRVKLEKDTAVELIEGLLIENGKIGPEGLVESRSIETEMVDILRYLPLIRHWPHAVIFPVSSEAAAELISNYKVQGYPIFGETTTAHIGLNGDQYFSDSWEEATSIVTDPPVQLKQADKLIQQLARLSTYSSSSGIDIISSHHKTVNATQRLCGQSDFRKITAGCIGVEERLSILWNKAVKSGLIDECDFVNLVSTNPAQLLNVYPARGQIAVGSIADIVVWDHSGVNCRIGNSSLENVDNPLVYKDMKYAVGKVDIVLINGEIQFENNAFPSKPNGVRLNLKVNIPLITLKMDKWKLSLQMESKKVERDPTKISDRLTTANAESNESNTEAAAQFENTKNTKAINGSDVTRFSRPPTSGGTRNMQDSSFSLSGTQIDDHRPNKSTIRTNQPPGGKSNITF